MTLGDAAEPLVHIKDFRMDFGDTTVIKDLSFDVRAGETFGFLGSNGSGKTTTIRALLGIYQATAGTLHISGRPFNPEDGGRLGYLPEERGLYKKEKVIDIMIWCTSKILPRTRRPSDTRDIRSAEESVSSTRNHD